MSTRRNRCSTPSPTSGVALTAGASRGSDGSVYAAAAAGGPSFKGELFKVTPSGTYVVIHDFSGGTDGQQPNGTPVFDGSGNLLGTTSAGGTSGCGVIYQLTPAGQYSVLANIQNGTNGACHPQAALLLASDGNYYTTTFAGGAFGNGTVIRYIPGSGVSVLHSFGATAGNTDGYAPYSALLLGSDGLLYGTTGGGGIISGNTGGFGTLFTLHTDGSGFSVVHTFAGGGSDGASPVNGLAQAAPGVYYGTAPYTAANGGGNGMVYQLRNGTYSVVYTFTGGSDGSIANAGLTLGGDGRLYSVTEGGGGSTSNGTFYRIDPSDNSFAVLAHFTQGRTQLAQAKTTLTLGGDGNFYGSAFQGGGLGNGSGSQGGALYEVTPAGVVSILFAASAPSNGMNPLGGLILDPASGDLYGTTQIGGTFNCGTLFRLAPTGDFSLVGALPGGGVGCNPQGGVVLAGDGNFYGSANDGGTAEAPNGNGTLFRVTPAGVYTAQHPFSGGSDGSAPVSGLLLGQDGKLYGTTPNAGADDSGTFFQLSTGGVFGGVQPFPGSGGAGAPKAAPIQGGDGNFYGTSSTGGANTQGTVYQLTPAGAFTILHAFGSIANDGSTIVSGLILGRDGLLYGTSETGGANSSGTVFKLATDGSGYQQIHSFGGVSHDSSEPLGSLLQASDGMLYGTSLAGGANNSGTIFRIGTDGGGYEVFYSFGPSGGGDGTSPRSGLVQGEDSMLYVPTFGGGASTVGAVVRLDGPPLIPSGLSAAVAGTTSVALNWSASAGAASYNVYQGTTAGGESATPVATGISGGSHTVTGLSTNTTYFFTVRAVNAVGLSLPSNEASAKPAAAPPAAPVVTATAASAKITLNWPAVSGATSYSVYQGTSPGGEGASPVKTGAARTVAITGLSNGTTYYFTVTATGASGTSAPSTEVSATPMAALTAPTGVVATAGAAKVTLSWNVVTSAQSYNVYQGTTAGGESATPVKSGSAARTVIVSGLTNGTTYYFKIAAVNGSTVGPMSAEVHATPVPAPTVPSGVVAAPGPGDGQITLNWNASTGATSYSVLQGTTAGGESATPVATGITGTSTVISSLTDGTTYYFKIIGVNGSGNSPRSAEVHAVPVAPPAAPTGVMATAGNGQVSLNWSAVAAATSYNVYRSTASGNEGTTPVASGITGTSTVQTGLTNGTTYFFKIAATTNGVVGAQSSEVSAKPLAPPAAPVVSATAGTGKITLSWPAVATATSYSVYQGTSPGGEGATPVSTGIARTVAISGLTKGTTYYFTVTASNAVGTGPASMEVSAVPN